ncbi:conserved hypothetical protein [Candidatus Sulfopaludibacter sp. SbA4]|nr:conserved hypothetical protein [Candidatus Sulfopaludibacter sp. SbA4]
MHFERAIQALCDAGVDFVVIGGVSATFHGSARVTYDLDVCYSRASSNLGRLTAALAPFHPRPRDFPDGLPFLWDERTLRNGTVFTLRTDIGEIDLLAEVAGIGDYGDAKARSIVVEAFDRRFQTLDLRALIQAKRAAGREKDLSALAELESLLEAGDS